MQNNPPNNLPSVAQFIEDLVTQLSDHTTLADNKQNDHARPLSRNHNQTPTFAFASSPGKLKPLMLTLHCIFPHELLLALDILDRRLVRRLVQEHKRNNLNQDIIPTNPREGLKGEAEDPTRLATEYTDGVFYVISTSSQPPESQSLDQRGYEVRLQAWNCTCPGFTISAFRDSSRESASHDDPMDCDVASQRHESCTPYMFGGNLTRRTLRSSPPVCKHLLACLLAVRCPGLLGPPGENACSVSVSVEELSGLCAGWGG